MNRSNKSRLWHVSRWYDKLVALLGRTPGQRARRTSAPRKLTLAVMELESRLVPSTVVYQRDFEPTTSPQLAPGVSASWSQTGKTTTPSGQTFLGEFGNQTVSLTLNGLPTHDAVTIGFDLYLLKTWDGSDNGTGSWGPDHWSMAANGTTLFDATFANRTDANSGHTNATQSFGGQDQPLGAYAGFTGAAEHGTLGYNIWRADFNRSEDMSAVYHLEFTVQATTATQIFSFTGSGLQGISDESWGLDNVQVSVDNNPIAADDLYLSETGESVFGNVLDNDTFSTIFPPTVTLAEEVTSGDLILNTDGGFSWTPPQNWPGTAVSFRYQLEGVSGYTASASVSIQAPYLIYLGSVSGANQTYNNSVLLAIDQRDTAIAAARIAAQPEADSLYADYDSATAAARDAYASAVDDAQAAYETALDDANAAWEAATASPRATYEAAVADLQANYDAAVAPLDAVYDAALADAAAAYEAAIAPAQAAWNDANAALLVDPDNPQLQAALAQAQADLDAATTAAAAQRDAANAAALADWNAGVDAVEAALTPLEQAAWEDYEAAIAPAEADWTTSEGAAWDTYQAALAAADATFAQVNDPAESTYLSAIAALEAQLDITEANIQDNLTTQLAAALSAWQTTEQGAWDSYGEDLATFGGGHALQARAAAPQQPQVPAMPPRQPLQQQVRPFGGALALVNGQLVIPGQYEIERGNRTIRQRLQDRLVNLRDWLRVHGLNAAGVLTGDIFDSNSFEYFNNLQANENSVLITINGMSTTQQDAQNLLNSVATFNVGTRKVAVVNGPHGLGQIEQIVFNELGRETVADLRAAVQIEIAAQALRNNGGQGQKTIYVVAHSQGTEVFFRALNFLSPQTRAMIQFYGVGGQRFVPNDIGLRSALNYYFSDDPIPRGANAYPLRRPYAIQHRYIVIRLPAAPGGSGHNWVNNYETIFNQPGRLTMPQGYHVIRYGGTLPFLELRRNQ